VRCSGIQLDTARYVRIQLDTVGYSGYSGSAAKWIDIESIQGYTGYPKDTVRYRRDTGKIQAGHPPNTRQGRAELDLQ